MTNIIASKKVIEGSEIYILHRLQDFWIVVSKGDQEEDINNIIDNFYTIDEDLIYERIPYLKGKLDQPVNTTINVVHSTGEININPKHFHFGIPTHSLKSNRQVNASFSFFRWLFIHRTNYLYFIIIEIVLFILAAVLGWFFYIPMGLYFIFELLSLLKQRDMFKSGDLCPGIVINEIDPKIAVLTDLSRGIGKFPIIRVKTVMLPRKYRVKGALIAVAGGYQTTGKYLHWNYFIPLPLPSGIKDEKLIEEKIKLIPTLEWVTLKSRIKGLQDEQPEGYYPFDIENSSWKDSNLFDIKWVK